MVNGKCQNHAAEPARWLRIEPLYWGRDVAGSVYPVCSVCHQALIEQGTQKPAPPVRLKKSA